MIQRQAFEAPAEKGQSPHPNGSHLFEIHFLSLALSKLSPRLDFEDANPECRGA